MNDLNAGRGRIGSSDRLAEPLRLADLTTVGVGGVMKRFVEPRTRQEFIDAVRDADDAGLPLLVIGGGSNLLVADEPFDGVVVRDARREVHRLGEGADAADGANTQTAQEVLLRADAGVNWDDFVTSCVNGGFSGIEGLSGVPGTVGASVVQNIGAYGQEVAQCVHSVEAWDRQTSRMVTLTHDDMHFGYRTSALKSSMYEAAGVPAKRFFPTPRYVVVSVTFVLCRSVNGVVAMGQLAKALGVEVGCTMPLDAIREAVLQVRAGKGMLEDPLRYGTPAMRGVRRPQNVAEAMKQRAVQASRSVALNQGAGTRINERTEAAHVARARADGGNANRAEMDQPDMNRHSCGSFFMNPVLSTTTAAALPADAPRFDVTLPDGTAGVKTSAAWLIDHAGFHKGFAVRPGAAAGLSTLHTLALTNRGGAKASDIAELARTIADGVAAAFGVRLVPEPVVVGMDLMTPDRAQ